MIFALDFCALQSGGLLRRARAHPLGSVPLYFQKVGEAETYQLQDVDLEEFYPDLVPVEAKCSDLLREGVAPHPARGGAVRLPGLKRS